MNNRLCTFLLLFLQVVLFLFRSYKMIPNIVGGKGKSAAVFRSAFPVRPPLAFDQRHHASFTGDFLRSLIAILLQCGDQETGILLADLLPKFLFQPSFANTSYTRNRLILQSDGGTVITYALLDFMGIPAGDFSARQSPGSQIGKRSPAPTVGRLQTKREASEVAPLGPTVLDCFDGNRERVEIGSCYRTARDSGRTAAETL
jgi:hypothetical protein